MKKMNPFIGKWRIIETELWDQDFIDMETEGYLHFDKNEMGSFHFGAVQGQIDYRIETIGGLERIEFSWEGQNEMDEALGRGWAIVNGNIMEGRFYFHLGDDSDFKAKKM